MKKQDHLASLGTAINAAAMAVPEGRARVFVEFFLLFQLLLNFRPSPSLVRVPRSMRFYLGILEFKFSSMSFSFRWRKKVDVRVEDESHFEPSSQSVAQPPKNEVKTIMLDIVRLTSDEERVNVHRTHIFLGVLERKAMMGRTSMKASGSWGPFASLYAGNAPSGYTSIP